MTDIKALTNVIAAFLARTDVILGLTGLTGFFIYLMILAGGRSMTGLERDYRCVPPMLAGLGLMLGSACLLWWVNTL